MPSMRKHVHLNLHASNAAHNCHALHRAMHVHCLHQSAPAHAAFALGAPQCCRNYQLHATVDACAVWPAAPQLLLNCCSAGTRHKLNTARRTNPLPASIVWSQQHQPHTSCVIEALGGACCHKVPQPRSRLAQRHASPELGVGLRQCSDSKSATSACAAA
jgi:hypothetical protein